MQFNSILLFDEAKVRQSLLPFTFTRPVGAMRCGILTIAEKWQHHFDKPVGYSTQDYLSSKFTGQLTEETLVMDGSLFPSAELLAKLKELKKGEVLYHNDKPFAAIGSWPNESNGTKIQLENVDSLQQKWEIFTKNGEQIQADYDLLTKGRTSVELNNTNMLIGKENIFVEEGAEVNGAILNASTGPIYIGRNAEIMEGSVVRGPLALCEGAALKLGTKIYGATTIGPKCKAGGEVNNSVLYAHSNKGHDGFLGNSVLGEWCNIGADTNTSNLKNNYAEVRLWDYSEGSFAKTGQQFCGLMMGDHSKCGINTMFNTGTVVGVSANIFGAGFPRNFIPSFTWGGASGFTTYRIDKAFETAEKVMPRRGLELNNTEKAILQHVFNETEQYRS